MDKRTLRPLFPRPQFKRDKKAEAESADGKKKYLFKGWLCSRAAGFYDQVLREMRSITGTIF